MRKVRYTIVDENGIFSANYSRECDIPTKDGIDRHTYLGLLCRQYRKGLGGNTHRG